jgi:hypothetical protein
MERIAILKRAFPELWGDFHNYEMVIRELRDTWADNEKLRRRLEINNRAMERYLPCPDCRDKVQAGQCQRCARQRAESQRDDTRAQLDGIKVLFGYGENGAQAAVQAKVELDELRAQLREAARLLDGTRHIMCDWNKVADWLKVHAHLLEEPKHG